MILVFVSQVRLFDWLPSSNPLREHIRFAIGDCEFLVQKYGSIDAARRAILGVATAPSTALSNESGGKSFLGHSFERLESAPNLS